MNMDDSFNLSIIIYLERVWFYEYPKRVRHCVVTRNQELRGTILEE